MSYKNKVIFGRVITFILAAVLIGAGIIKSNTGLLYMGVSLLAVNTVMTVKNILILSNPEKLKEVEAVYNDEREKFIAGKSYSFAFWTSVYIEFFAVIYFSYKDNTDYSTLVAALLCLKVILYAVSNIFYSKKY